MPSINGKSSFIEQICWIKWDVRSSWMLLLLLLSPTTHNPKRILCRYVFVYIICWTACLPELKNMHTNSIRLLNQSNGNEYRIETRICTNKIHSKLFDKKIARSGCFEIRVVCCSSEFHTRAKIVKNSIDD